MLAPPASVFFSQSTAGPIWGDSHQARQRRFVESSTFLVILVPQLIDWPQTTEFMFLGAPGPFPLGKHSFLSQIVWGPSCAPADSTDGPGPWCGGRAFCIWSRYVPKTSLSSPPWPEIVLPDPAEETRHHAEVVRKVNELIATGQYGRLFAVVHFASHQWKVTSEDLILIGNDLDLQCGERIRLEKVLLVGADNFTLLGKPLLGKDLVRVEATVIEKTESWPRIIMRFRKRKNFRKKRIVVTPQTVLRINSIEIAPCLS
ncbi:large ribosomal subunit protein bL21m isoform X1 [Aotus nancymaae]|uniref:large ribosomal subunit protein bL21m isoform X1 n=1 Tax=Aotus nancymaae TaxID=37293 RepID=UPI0030FF1B64